MVNADKIREGGSIQLNRPSPFQGVMNDLLDNYSQVKNKFRFHLLCHAVE